MTIYEAICDDHAQQRTLVGRLVDLQSSPAERSAALGALCRVLDSHALAEERCFYVPLMLHGSTVAQSRHGIAEHRELDGLIATLGDTDAASPTWLPAARRLQRRLEHHLTEEEGEMFVLAREILDPGESAHLGRRFLEEIHFERGRYRH
ncbi:MAG: hemerythrin domain-containing protein [Rhodocyclaceae bacterium]|nr:hemerythrin domain-containing protein [Rhodocyclaceae bacterium]